MVERELPKHFTDYEAFRDFLLARYPDDATTVEKGTSFRDFVITLLPRADDTARFGPVRANPKHSHDRGVDVISADDRPEQLAAQCKLSIRTKDEIDSIVSKFEDYEATSAPQPQLGLIEFDESVPLTTYLIATSSKVEGLRQRYEQADFSSLRFYRRLQSEKRILWLDGGDLMREMRQIYRRRFEIPVELDLVSEQGWVAVGGVHLGVVSASDVVALEVEHGEALFFENVRGFKGTDQVKDGETVNEAIRASVRHNAARFHILNNGLTLRAAEVIEHKDGRLTLRRASIVNGRQTTGVLALEGSALSRECRVIVKVVQAEGDAWDVAEAANNQNAVARINLKLARFFRPQLVQKQAASGDDLDDVEDLVSGIRDTDAEYQHIRALFLGIFCRRPNQLFDDNYSKLRFDVLDRLYDDGDPPIDFFPTLQKVARATDEALAYCADLGVEDPIQRVHEEQRPKYRAYLGLLTLAAEHEHDLVQDRNVTVEDEVALVVDFVRKSASLLETPQGRARYRDDFTAAYETALEMVLSAYEEGSDARVQQRLSGKFAGTSFGELYRRVLLKLRIQRRRELLRSDAASS